MPPSPTFVPSIVTKAITTGPHTGRAIASAGLQQRQAAAPAPAHKAKPQSAQAAQVEAAKRLRRKELTEAMHHGRSAAPIKAKTASLPTHLPTAPMLAKHPDHMDVFARRELLVQMDKYLRVADTIGALRGLTRTETDDVARVQRERRVLSQHVGMWQPAGE